MNDPVRETTMRNVIAMAATAFAGALVGIALSASAAQFTTNGGGPAGGVSRAEFNRLQGQVQAIEGRVTALERMSGHSGGQTGGHKSGSGHR
jgi:hypothetical protein